MRLASKFRFYFSFRSPFAAIAYYRLRRSALFNEFDIEMIPVWPEIVFGGHMDNPTDNLFKLAYVFADAARQAEEAGLSSVYFRSVAKRFKPPKDIDYSKQKVGLNMPPEDWAVTHHAFLYAQEQGKGWEFGDAVFAHRFDFDGGGSRDVMDAEVLRAIATEVGLDADCASNAQTSGDYEEAQSALVKRGEADGVFGVPFFAFDHNEGTEVFWGNDRLPSLYKTLTGARDLPVMDANSLGEIQTRRK
jgi:2-hydroxychromene-2-carboxylate isomerase